MALAYGARVGTASGTTHISSFNITLTAGVPAGSLIIVSVFGGNTGDTSNLTSVTDSASNTYTSAGFVCDVGQNTLCAVWFCKNCSALSSSQTVTVTFHTTLQAAGEAWAGAVDYFTGADTTAPQDGSGQFSTATAASWATPNLTTTNANDVCWVAYADNQAETAAITQGASSPTSGWTIQTGITVAGNGLRTSYQIFSSTGTYKGGGTEQTGSNGSSFGIVAFKAASGGGGGTPSGSTLSLMGVG